MCIRTPRMYLQSGYFLVFSYEQLVGLSRCVILQHSFVKKLQNLIKTSFGILQFLCFLSIFIFISFRTQPDFAILFWHLYFLYCNLNLQYQVFFSLDVFSFLDVVITTANYFNSENNCVKKDIMQFFFESWNCNLSELGGLQKWQTLNYLQDGIVKGKKNTPILIQVIQSRTWHWETFSLLFPYFDDEIPFESKGVWSYKYTYWFKNMENGIFKLNYMKLPYF